MPKPMRKLRPLTAKEARMNFGAFSVKKPPFYGKGTQLSKNAENIEGARVKRARRKNFLESLKKNRN